jgi:hypothetical protein
VSPPLARVGRRFFSVSRGFFYVGFLLVVCPVRFSRSEAAVSGSALGQAAAGGFVSNARFSSLVFSADFRQRSRSQSAFIFDLVRPPRIRLAFVASFLCTPGLLPLHTPASCCCGAATDLLSGTSVPARAQISSPLGFLSGCQSLGPRSVSAS